MLTEPDGRATIALDPQGRMCVRVRGEVDLASASRLQECADAAIARAGPDGVLLDLAECTFMDASGLRALVAAMHGADEHHRKLRITGAHGAVLRVIQLTDLDGILPIDV
jgi:anti-sigma B factor antagonist